MDRLIAALEKIAKSLDAISGALDQMCLQDPATGAGYLRTITPDQIDTLAASHCEESEENYNSERTAAALEFLVELLQENTDCNSRIETHLAKFAETIERKRIQVAPPRQY